MALRSPSAITALVAMAVLVSGCLPDRLSDAERVWCDDRAVTIVVAADVLDIGPEPKGSVDSPETLSQWSYKKASLDRDWVRACKAAYEAR